MIDNVRIVAVEIVCERNESLVNRVVKEDDEDAFEELRVLVEDVSGRSLTSQKACELLGEHLGVDFVESEDENVDSVDEGAEYLSGFPVVNTKGERLAFLNPNSSDKIYHLVDLDEEADSDRKMRYQWGACGFSSSYASKNTATAMYISQADFSEDGLFRDGEEVGKLCENCLTAVKGESYGE